MAEETTKTKLHLVPHRRRVQLSLYDFVEPGSQGVLFPVPRQGLLIFMLFPEVTEQEFRQTLEFAKPSSVFELRTAPRFDIGQMNRQLAFEFFERQSTAYFDLTSSLRSSIPDEALMIENLRDALRTKKPSFHRPVIFLLNRVEVDETFTARVLDTVTSFGVQLKQIFEVPRFEHSSNPIHRVVAG